MYSSIKEEEIKEKIRLFLEDKIPGEGDGSFVEYYINNYNEIVKFFQKLEEAVPKDKIKEVARKIASIEFIPWREEEEEEEMEKKKKALGPYFHEKFFERSRKQDEAYREKKIEKKMNDLVLKRWNKAEEQFAEIDSKDVGAYWLYLRIMPYYVVLVEELPEMRYEYPIRSWLYHDVRYFQKLDKLRNLELVKYIDKEIFEKTKYLTDKTGVTYQDYKKRKSAVSRLLKKKFVCKNKFPIYEDVRWPLKEGEPLVFIGFEKDKKKGEKRFIFEDEKGEQTIVSQKLK